MKINYYLDRPEAEQTFIAISISVNGWNLKTSTKIYLSPKDVRLKAGSKTKVLSIKGKNTTDVFRGQLEAIDSKVRNYILQNNTKLDLTKDQMKFAMKDIVSGQKPNRDHLLIATYERWLELRKNSFAKTTYASKRTTLKYIKSSLGAKDIPLSEFNTKKFFIDLKEHLSGKNISINTIDKTFRDLRLFGKWASEPEQRYIDKLLAPERLELTEVESFAITYSDIDALYNCDLLDTHYLKNIRDTFLLQCLTGLRYSDLTRLGKETDNAAKFNFIRLENGEFDKLNSYIALTTQKTKTPIKIPLQSRLWKLLERRDFDLNFYTSSLSRYNKYVKQICKLVSLPGEGKKVWFENGVRQEKFVPIYDLVSSHTARRSYVTNLLRLGMSPDIIAKTTGHKNGLSFQKYIKFIDDDVKNAFANIT